MGIFAWIIEFFYWLINAVSPLFGFIPVPPTVKNPIIIVTGGFTAAILYLPFKKHLEAKGFEVHVINFSSTKGIEFSAKNLSEYLDKNHLTNVVLVGISTGSIASYVYLNKMDGWEKTKRFISIAGPFRGTFLAYFSIFSKTGRELLPGSSFMKHFETIKNLHTERTYTIHAEKDELVPFWSSKIPCKETIIIPVYGHVRVHSFSKETFDTVAKIAKD